MMCRSDLSSINRFEKNELKKDFDGKGRKKYVIGAPIIFVFFCEI